MATAQHRNWMGRTPQARASERRQQLIEAAIELLGTKGAAAITLRAVCGEAGLSLKFFYESFCGRDELLLAAYDTTVSRLLAVLDDVDPSDAGTPTGALRQVMATIFEYLQTDPRVARILFREPFSVDALRMRAQSTVPTFFKTVLDPGGELSLTPFQLAAVGGALVGIVIDRMDGILVEDTDAFVDSCTDVVIRLIS